jgi:soluble lytic murein transglycosylase-like protein
MRKSTARHWISVSTVLFAFTFAAQAQAEIYTYTDERGVVHYTNVPTDKRYRRIKSSLPPAGKPRLTIRSLPAVRSIDRRQLRFGKKPYRSKFDHHIEHAARINQVDPMLVKAVIKTESNFNRYAVSPKGAQGLMQLMPSTAKYLKVGDPFDPWQNIYGGTRYLRELLDTFDGNVRLSLAAYNAGPTRVRRLGAVPRIPETVSYVGKVLRLYQNYSHQGRYSYTPLKTSIHVRQLVTVN